MAEAELRQCMDALAEDASRAADSAPDDLSKAWRTIETAPKDGTRVVLWRGFCSFGKWAEMVVAEWHEDAWCWPSDSDDPSTHAEWSEDALLCGYSSDRGFTHWMPLPDAPAPARVAEGGAA